MPIKREYPLRPRLSDYGSATQPHSNPSKNDFTISLTVWSGCLSLLICVETKETPEHDKSHHSQSLKTLFFSDYNKKTAIWQFRFCVYSVYCTQVWAGPGAQALAWKSLRKWVCARHKVTFGVNISLNKSIVARSCHRYIINMPSWLSPWVTCCKQYANPKRCHMGSMGDKKFNWKIWGRLASTWKLIMMGGI